MKNILKKAGKGVLFVLVFLAIGALLMCVMEFKYEDGTLPVHNYYSLPKDTVDVLILGTSHAGMNISTKTLWDEYGIAGYRFWGSIQPIWNTYYYLQEALKYQTPKVVLLDAYSLTFQQEYGAYPVQVKNTIALRLSKEKVENIWASVPEEDRAFMLFGFSTYHNRYTELTQEDFEYFPWDSHQDIQMYSTETSDKVYPITVLDPDATQGEEALGEKEEKYFRMLLEYCRTNGVKLEVVAAPYELSAAEQQKFRRVASIVEEYGFDFTNFNDSYAEIDIDPLQDFLDPGHFNKFGLPKYARAIAELLISKYDLPDRRQDPNHIWNQTSAMASTPAYAATEQFQGDGIQDFSDTGFRLYENPLASWTLCTKFTLPETGDNTRVVMACFNDVPGMGGFRVCRAVNGKMEITIGATMTIRVADPEDVIRLVVVKKGKAFTIYVNGNVVEDVRLIDSELNAYEGSLLLGCEVSAEGRRMHFGKTLIRDLVIYDSALGEADALAWEPQQLPLAEKAAYMKEVTRDDLILSLENRFVGDGQEYVDTGCRLFDDPESSFTLLSQIEPRIEAGDTVYFSCFSEEPGAYRGLLVRKIGEDTLNVIYGAGTGVNLTLPKDAPSRLAVVKDRSAYTVYLNGEKVLDQSASPCTAYNGSFLIGAQTDASGNIFRVSGTTVYNLDVYRGLMAEEQIVAWRPEPLAEAPRDPGMDVTYTLSPSFVGNGKSAYVDTGLKLYDNPDKDWTVSLLLDRVTVRRGSVISCFDETPGKYRGLLVRQTSDTVFSFILGSEYVEVEIHPADQVILSIVKEGNHYRVYLNGRLEAEKDCKIASYLGNLYIGCERNQYGRPFRFSDISVRRLEAVSEALTDETVLALHQAWKEETK